MLKPLFLSFCFAILSIPLIQAQEEMVKDSVIDTNYREDQFYIGATYNVLINKPDGVTQSGFSIGLHLGFIRDFPINNSRTKAIGVGLGLSTNSYNQNLLINEVNNDIEFSVLDGSQVDFSKNKFFTHLIELPIEYRWRNSSPTTYKFWRVYGGFKLGYMLRNGTNFKGDLGSFKIINSDVFNKFQYGLTLSTGYNTWNFHVYYALNTLFNDQVTSSQTNLDVSEIRVGLMFYLL
jgi:hypothetical protein